MTAAPTKSSKNKRRLEIDGNNNDNKPHAKKQKLNAINVCDQFKVSQLRKQITQLTKERNECKQGFILYKESAAKWKSKYQKLYSRLSAIANEDQSRTVDDHMSINESSNDTLAQETNDDNENEIKNRQRVMTQNECLNMYGEVKDRLLQMGYDKHEVINRIELYNGTGKSAQFVYGQLIHTFTRDSGYSSNSNSQDRNVTKNDKNEMDKSDEEEEEDNDSVLFDTDNSEYIPIKDSHKISVQCEQSSDGSDTDCRTESESESSNTEMSDAINNSQSRKQKPYNTRRKAKRKPKETESETNVSVIKKVKKRKKHMRNMDGSQRCGRLLLSDALKDTVSMEGWSEARITSWKQRNEKPNAYYYRFNANGEDMGRKEWTQTEHRLFMLRLLELGVNKEWGIFSKTIPGRVGYACSNYWRQLMKSSEVFDPNYCWDKHTKKFKFLRNTKTLKISNEYRRYAFTVNRDESNVWKSLPRKHPKHPNQEYYELVESELKGNKGNTHKTVKKRRKKGQKD